MLQFDLQMFDEETEELNLLEGIDADIIKDLTGGEPEEVETSEEESDTEEPEPETDDADTDTKQYQGKGNIPYERFREVNESKKSAEARVKELEAQLAELRQKSNTVEETPAPKESVIPKPAESPKSRKFTIDQLNQIASMAVKNAREELGLSDDEADDLEFSDDISKKILYQQTIAENIARIKRDAIKYQEESENEEAERANTMAEFNKLASDLNSHPDAQQRWNFIGQEMFNALPERKKTVIDAAFRRLQQGKGSNADMVLVGDYFENATRVYEQRNGIGVNNAPKTADKLTKAKALPKASSVGGKSGKDVVWDIDGIAKAMNSKGGIDNLPPEILQQVLRGRLE